MQNSRDSSVWRTLAVAFGDGLAFGAGVTLTRGAARLAANRTAAPAQTPPLNGAHNAGWRNQLEQRSAATPTPSAAPVSIAPLEAAIDGISRRVAETGGQIDRRLVEMENRLQRELAALDDQDHELAQGVETRLDAMRLEIAASIGTQRQTLEDELRTLRSRVASVHRELAETLARFMDEQIAKNVTARMQSMEATLRAAVREESEAAGHGRQIAELRELIEAQDRNMRSIVLSLGESCLKAAAPPPAQEQLAEAHVAGTLESDLPEFARPRARKPLWRLPVVSSCVAATGSLLLMHYI